MPGFGRCAWVVFLATIGSLPLRARAEDGASNVAPSSTAPAATASDVAPPADVPAADPMLVACKTHRDCAEEQFCQVDRERATCAPLQPLGVQCTSSFQCRSGACANGSCGLHAVLREQKTEAPMQPIPGWGAGFAIGGTSVYTMLQLQRRVTDWFILEVGGLAWVVPNGRATTAIAGGETGARFELPWPHPLRPYIGIGAGAVTATGFSSAWLSTRVGASYYFRSTEIGGVKPLFSVELNALYMSTALFPIDPARHIQIWPGIAMSALFGR